MRTVSSGMSSIGRLDRSRIPAPKIKAAHASDSRFWPSGRSNRRIRMSTPAQRPAAAMTVPSPNGRWNGTPSARRLSRNRTPTAIKISATSTQLNGPNVDTISSSEPTAATRCSEPRTRQACLSSELLPARETCIRLVPMRDLVFAFLPAEVDLAAVAQRREVDQPALEVAHDHLHRVELAGCCLQLEEGLGHDPTGFAAAVAGRRLAQRFAGVFVGEAVARRAQAFYAFHHPWQRRVRLFDRVMPLVVQPNCSSRWSIN